MHFQLNVETTINIYDIKYLSVTCTLWRHN